MDFKYKKAGTIFNMHSYWTKQPLDPIKYFIEKYTKEGDTVLDPFSGSGMTGIAALQLKRNIILNDISPLSIHISKGYCTNFNLKQDYAKYETLKESILEGVSDLYLTHCTKCGCLAPISFSIVGEIWSSKDGLEIENRGLLMLNNKENVKFKKDYIFKEFSLLKICYNCKCSKGKQYKEPDSFDIEKYRVKKYENLFIPKEEFFGQEPKRNYKKGIRSVYQMYSARNLSALAIINERIIKINDARAKQLFKFIFSSILFNSSLMSRYRSYENTSIKMGTFYIPPLIKDTNVYDNFINKYKNVTKGNIEIFDSLEDENINSLFLIGSADELPDIKDNSVDYIYTDPPYSDIISYSELNIVYESWLNIKTNQSDEMIVSKAQGKDIKYFSNKFRDTLLRCRDVLKDGKYLTLVFHHPNIEHWYNIQESFEVPGLEPILTEEPTRLISNSKTSSQHKTNKATQDFLIFNFKKNSSYKGKSIKNLNDEDYKSLLTKIRNDAIIKGYTASSDTFDYIVNYLIFRYKIKPSYRLI